MHNDKNGLIAEFAADVGELEREAHEWVFATRLTIAERNAKLRRRDSAIADKARTLLVKLGYIEAIRV